MPARLKRVVLLCTALNAIGGTSRHMAQIYRWLDKGKFRPFIVFSSLQEASLRDFFIKEGCAPEDIRAIPHVTRCLCGAFKGLRRAWHELKPDIVHSFFLHSDILSRATTFFMPSIVRVSSVEGKFIWDRDNGVGAFKNACYRLLNTRVRKSFARTITVSSELKDEVVAMGGNKERITIVPVGVPVVEVGLLKPRPPQADIVAGTLSRFSQDKGVDLLLQAAAACRQELARVSFILGGAGDEEAPLKAMARDLGIVEMVVFPGWVEDVTGFLNGIDIYVMPSRREGCPLGLMEAMMHAKACVVFDVPGVRAIARHEQNALVIPAFDTAAFGKAICRLALDRQLRAALGARARSDAVARHSLAREMKELEAVYVQAGKA